MSDNNFRNLALNYYYKHITKTSCLVDKLFKKPNYKNAIHPNNIFDRTNIHNLDF